MSNCTIVQRSAQASRNENGPPIAPAIQTCIMDLCPQYFQKTAVFANVLIHQFPSQKAQRSPEMRLPNYGLRYHAKARSKMRSLLCLNGPHRYKTSHAIHEVMKVTQQCLSFRFVHVILVYAMPMSRLHNFSQKMNLWICHSRHSCAPIEQFSLRTKQYPDSPFLFDQSPGSSNYTKTQAKIRSTPGFLLLKFAARTLGPVNITKQFGFQHNQNNSTPPALACL